MAKPSIPKDYKSQLNLYETQIAIKTVKDFFQSLLAERLDLLRVSAPLFVDPASGMNDNLNGIERPVNFDIKEQNAREAEIVQSLAKWKRYALKKYGFSAGEGLYTDMSAIRRDEVVDNIHSIYVDQWDWEKIIPREKRTLDYLKKVVTSIVEAICETCDQLHAKYPQLKTELSRDVKFITSQELEDLYPDLDGKGRENAYVKEHKTVFIMQIGEKLRSGKPHDGRAPDYDDWQLNGDLMFWNETLGAALEISSMGIRVDAASLDYQLNAANCNERRELEFHKMLLNDELPLTIGGGIGQSRLCMLMIGCAHIGEVQSSIWDAETVELCQSRGVKLL